MIHSFVNAFLKEEDGQDLVEYSLLLAFVALAAVGVLSTVRTQLVAIWTKINTDLTTATSKMN
jgi:pilus assembly protein Flp/PilA